MILKRWIRTDTKVWKIISKDTLDFTTEAMSKLFEITRSLDAARLNNMDNICNGEGIRLQ